MRTLVGVLFYGESEFYDFLVCARRAFAGWVRDLARIYVMVGEFDLEHWQCGQEKS